MRAAHVCSIALVACAAVSTPGEVLITRPVIIPETSSQALFDDAMRWSREHHLETGGCFHVFQVVGRKVIVFDATERVVWRRDMRVALRCSAEDGIWHTHWLPEGPTSAGCNVNIAMDLYLISQKSALGLVVCGIGRDSIRPYDYSPVAAAKHEEYLKLNPDVAEQERLDAKEADDFTCANESQASLARPTIYCRK